MLEGLNTHYLKVKKTPGKLRISQADELAAFTVLTDHGASFMGCLHLMANKKRISFPESRHKPDY